VNNSSIGGLIGIPAGPSITQRNTGVIGLTKSAALNMPQRHLHQSVCPGAIENTDGFRHDAKEPKP